MDSLNIVISGEGGQGIQTIADIFSRSAFDIGYNVSYIPSFGVEQRGTPSIAFVKLSKKELRGPEFNSADYIVVLQKRSISRIEQFLNKKTKLIFDSSTIAKNELPDHKLIFGIPATMQANTAFHHKSFNIIILGVIAELFEIPYETVWRNVLHVMGHKIQTEELKNITADALKFGMAAELEVHGFSKAIYKSKHKEIKLKGHGKTGEILPSRCKGCGICIVRCPVGALSFDDDLGVLGTPIPKVDLEKCIACGNCLNFCPDGAISILKD